MSLPLEVIKFLIPIQEKMKEALGDYIGFYLHGSLALGGFQHQTSDVDILILKYRSTINWALAAYYGKIALIDKRELIAVKNYLLEKVTNS